MAEELSDQQLAYFADLLANREVELQARLQTLEARSAPVTLDQQSVGRVSRIDAIQQQQMAKADAGQVQRLLRRVVAARGRLEQGDFGYCSECDQVIAAARLEIQPETSLCLSCQQKQEENI